MTAGSTPATAVETTRAIGRRPSARARSASTSRTADAPSLIPELLPAVTVPPSAGRPAAAARAPRGSSVGARVLVAGRRSTGSPFRCGTATGTIWSSNRPASIAATARCWLSSAKASWRSRRDAPALGDVLGGLAHRVRVVALGQPRVDEAPAERRVGQLARRRGPRRASGLSWTYGARVIDSTPPPMNTSPSPTAIAWAAVLIAWSPDPHSRLTVCPPTSTGKPGEQERPSGRRCGCPRRPGWRSRG